MTISTLCLLQLQAPPVVAGLVTRATALQDAVLLHTELDFATDPEDLAQTIRRDLGEALAQQHGDTRGVLLIPSIAAPKARSYAEVIAEVGEGGVWAPWSAPAQLPDLGSLLGGMLGNMSSSSMFAAAAASLQADPSALRQASEQLPGLLNNPGQLAQLMDQASEHMPELSEMLRGLGIDFASPEIQQLTQGLQAELARDPARLAQLAERLMTQGAAEEDEDDEDR